MDGSRITTLSAILVLIAFAATQALPVATASGSATVSLSPTSDAQTCFLNINRGLAQLPVLSPEAKTLLLQVAESSSQYIAFAEAGGPISVVSPGPAIEYRTSPECAGITVEAYTFSFVSGLREISIAVDPSSMTVLRTLTVPAIRHGVALNSTGCCWGGGYGYWNGSTYSNPTYPYWYIEGQWSIPSVSTSDSNQDDYSIWSGLTDYYLGNHIAQTGMDAFAQSGHSSSYKLWYEFYPAGTSYCTFTVNSGNSLLSASYNNAWSTSGGSTSTYDEDTYDPNVSQGCSYSGYSWSSGLGSSSYFALLMGETLQQPVIENFGSVTITGTIYDNHYNGGPSGHCTSTPYNSGYAESFYYTHSSHIATESLDNGHCAFNDNYH